MKKILVSFLLLLGAASLSAQPALETDKQALYNAEVREKLALDYSMPDYTVNKIDEKMMGPRLTAILKRLNDNYNKRANIDLLNIIQTRQVEGLSYARIKKMDFDTVTKVGNKITMSFKTWLDSNNLGLKNATLTFNFIDSVSDDKSTNEIFCMICRYIKE